MSGRFNLVTANIVADVIMMLNEDILKFLSKDGIYIMSGIIDTRENDVLENLEGKFEVFGNSKRARLDGHRRKTAMTDKITDISAAAGADILSSDKTGVPAADRSAAAIQAQPADGSDGLTTVKEQQLGGGMTVFTNDIHTFGTDAVLLASFAQPRKSTKAVELGTGCGIISLIWCRDGKCASIDAIDIQKRPATLLTRRRKSIILALQAKGSQRRFKRP